MDQNLLNNSGRGLPKVYLCEIISKLDQGFRRSCHLSQLLTDGRRRTKTDHISSPCHFVPCHFVTSELKANMHLLQMSVGQPSNPLFLLSINRQFLPWTKMAPYIQRILKKSMF